MKIVPMAILLLLFYELFYLVKLFKVELSMKLVQGKSLVQEDSPVQNYEAV